MHNFVRISLILALIFGTVSRAHAILHQQDVAHILTICSGGSTIVVMLDGNGDPVKRQVTCPDCIFVLALADISTGVMKLHDANVQAHQYWTAQSQCASVVSDGFQQRGPPFHF